LLRRLYESAHGDPAVVHPSLDASYMCDLVCLASRYSIEIDKRGALTGEFDAALSALASGIESGLTLRYSRTSDKTFKIDVDTSAEYLIGIGVRRWWELAPD
jgi:hypothetical protein